MKISHIAVKNYRSLKNVSFEVDNYSALVGANGAGKSSILYALDWFFNGRTLEPSDVCGYEEGVTADEDCVVEVAVTFSGLTDHDRERLRQYGRGAQATFQRTWSIGQKDKVVGNATQGPGFAEIRSFTKVGDFRPDTNCCETPMRNFQTSVSLHPAILYTMRFRSGKRSRAIPRSSWTLRTTTPTTCSALTGRT
ncbi:AAA family ATPase [Lacisediminihabitans profunda]|uniref:AAA family ATPase n=1 Tax=Lacisediminihabitans profunda TaxID=2594790 RepID=UPI001650B4C7